jgi:hypothetical protein
VNYKVCGQCWLNQYEGECKMLFDGSPCRNCDEDHSNLTDLIQDFVNNPKYKYIGSGASRAVFKHHNYVIKIPHTCKGVFDNERERHLWMIRRYPYHREFSYARCRLYGFILVMQYAHFPIPGKTDGDGFVPYEHLPEWASFIDCQQVGYNRFGELVAYDYA